MVFRSLSLGLLALGSLTRAAPAPAKDVNARALGTVAYAPTKVTCPSEDLVRPATSLNSDEASYIASRTPKANAGLKAWLAKQGDFSCDDNLPSVGFASSGGGLRTQLTTAGVIKALDGRDSDVGTSGLYQGLTYESGLSGGAWFLSSLAANNWPTVSSLVSNIWEAALAESILLPAYVLSTAGATEYAVIAADLAAKEAAGYQTSIVDAWGRLLSYSLLAGNDAGVADRLSGLSSLSNFTEFAVPFPIMTALGNLLSEGQCYPAFNSTIYEFSCFEWGSWDSGVSAFANTQYMGTNMTDGKPRNTAECTEHYDNIGYILGTSSDVFNAYCPSTIEPSNSTDDLEGVLEQFVADTHGVLLEDEFALYPNPFYNYPRSTLVSSMPLLTLSDGGESDQNVPIWPFIAGARELDVLIANDNSADTDTNFPNGTEIHQTYLNAVEYGHERMPYIPDVSTFVAEGLNKRATFFGCEDAEKMFIIYLPNVAYTFASNTSTDMLQYTDAETNAMIKNGMEIATQNGTSGWPFCFACGIMKNSGDLPTGCNKCFDEYCYRK